MPLHRRFFRGFWPLFALTGALILAPLAHAQTETPTAPQDVTVAVTVANRPTRLAAELIGLPVQNRLQADFAAAGYRAMRSQPDAAQMRIELTPHDADKTVTAQITLSDSFLPVLPSPILISSAAPVLITGPQGDDAMIAAISGAALALTTAVETCVSAPIASPLPSSNDSNLLTGTLDFYAANCSAARGELTAARAGYLDALDSLTQADVPFSARIAPTVNLAWVAYQQDNAAAAFDALGKLLDAATAPADCVEILRKRSELLALDFKFADAIADIRAAIDLSPKDPSLYVELGQRILLTYEWDQVLDAYNQAIAVDPTYAAAYFQRGVLFYTEGPRANALKDFQKYLELAPDGEFASDAQSYIGGIQQTTAGEIQQGK